ncbi:lysozyme inhibitor LprI family protein [Enterobacter sp. Bisph1]|uniref:lysozyme inhibitor LprI family protein n=1 Tax=Enterobacter sp. Bisph1 TaxID=1274399 RepID=UPI0009E455C5|nr:lysozyme inhibitor LprI family protein [Enterobacter sp. Bisph1]
MTNHKVLLQATAIFAAFMLPFFAQASNTPLQGEWQVEEAFVNTETERTLNYQFNDDRLVGRFLSITAQGISTTLPGGANCQSPTFKESSTTLDAWIAATQSIDEKGAAKAYDLGLEGNAKTQVETVTCATGHFANGSPGGNASLASINQRLLLNWTDGTVLQLKPVDKNSKPQPSFNCVKAASASEKAICGDRELASLDQSVARSYASMRTEAVTVGNKELEKKLQTQQKAWLTQRNSCNADVQCLKKSMNDRLETLAHSLDGV